MITDDQIDSHCDRIISLYIQEHVECVNTNQKPFMLTYFNDELFSEFKEHIRVKFIADARKIIQDYASDKYNVVLKGNILCRNIALLIWDVHAGHLINNVMSHISSCSVRNNFINKYCVCLEHDEFLINTDILDAI